MTVVRSGSEDRGAQFPMIHRGWMDGLVVGGQVNRRIERKECSGRKQGRCMESAGMTAVPTKMGRRASRRRTVGSRHVALVLTDADVRKIVVSASYVRSEARHEQRKHERHRARRIAQQSNQGAVWSGRGHRAATIPIERSRAIRSCPLLSSH